MAPDPIPEAPRFVDITHLVFLEMLQSYLDKAGPNEVNRFLVKTAAGAAETFPHVAFESMNDFVAAIEELRNPIARVEGRAEHLGDGLFGLSRCPFADTYKTHKRQYQQLGPRLAVIQEVFNRPSEATARYSVGHGSAVCPFCCVHQPLRAAIAGRVTIGGRSIKLVQLACKGADGSRAFADEYIALAGRSHAEIDRVLDQYVCCYAISAKG